MARFTVKVKKKVVRESDADSINIGTRSSCVVSIEDSIAAEVHACIRYEGGKFLLEDKGTATGTWLGGLPVEGPTAIAEGDQIVVGKTRLTATITGSESGFELELLLAEKNFFFDKGDIDQAARDEVAFGQYSAMRVGNWVAAVAALVLIPLAFFVRPVSDPLLDPGGLHPSHAQLFEHPPEFFEGNARLVEFATYAQEEGCAACHDSFNRTPMSKCAHCHEDVMRDQHPFTVEPVGPSEKSLKGYGENSCLDCHVDHRAGDPLDREYGGRFRGAFIPSVEATTATCADCHGEGVEFDAESIGRLYPETPMTHLSEVVYETFPHDKHLLPGQEIDCVVCHEREESIDGRTTADHDFAVVPYETCMTCHSESPEQTEVAWLPPAELRFQVDWHGTDDPQNCLQCHGELNQEPLNQVTSAMLPVEQMLAYQLDRRHHADEFAAHMTGDKDCTECHPNGDVSPVFASIVRPFRHGVHAANLTADSAACDACHVEQREATELSTDVYPGAAGKCDACHRNGVGEALKLEPALVAAREAAQPVQRTDFPHGLHTEVEGGCFACHEFDSESPRYDALVDTRADAKDCTQCHSTHQSIAGGDCAACHQAGDPSYSGDFIEREWPELNTFDHFSEGHADVACADCHEGTEEATLVSAVKIPTESDASCRKCHVEEKKRFHWR